jgi:hypothetical protein
LWTGRPIPDASGWCRDDRWQKPLAAGLPCCALTATASYLSVSTFRSCASDDARVRSVR